MQPRLNHRKAAPGAFRGLDETRRYLDACGLDRKLRLLVEIRVSQINGCAYCVDKHLEEARVAGETAQRLDCLCVWRETPFFDARERAALAWAEALTLLAPSHAPDDVYDPVRAQFDDKTLTDLTVAIALINAFNRFGVGFRLPPPQRC